MQKIRLFVVADRKFVKPSDEFDISGLELGIWNWGCQLFKEWALRVPVSIKNLKISRCQRWCSEFRRVPGTRGTRANSSPVYVCKYEHIKFSNFFLWRHWHHKVWFLTAILHRGLRNDFSFFQVAYTFFNILFGLLSPSSIWSFTSLFYLDFYFPFLFGFLFPFSICFFFCFFSILSRSLILDSSKFFSWQAWLLMISRNY